jgi:hypothetical protein
LKLKGFLMLSTYASGTTTDQWAASIEAALAQYEGKHLVELPPPCSVYYRAELVVILPAIEVLPPAAQWIVRKARACDLDPRSLAETAHLMYWEM